MILDSLSQAALYKPGNALTPWNEGLLQTAGLAVPFVRQSIEDREATEEWLGRSSAKLEMCATALIEAEEALKEMEEKSEAKLEEFERQAKSANSLTTSFSSFFSLQENSAGKSRKETIKDFCAGIITCVRKFGSDLENARNVYELQLLAAQVNFEEDQIAVAPDHATLTCASSASPEEIRGYRLYEQDAKAVDDEVWNDWRESCASGVSAPTATPGAEPAFYTEDESEVLLQLVSQKLRESAGTRVAPETKLDDARAPKERSLIERKDGDTDMMKVGRKEVGGQNWALIAALEEEEEVVRSRSRSETVNAPVEQRKTVLTPVVDLDLDLAEDIAIKVEKISELMAQFANVVLEQQEVSENIISTAEAAHSSVVSAHSEFRKTLQQKITLRRSLFLFYLSVGSAMLVFDLLKSWGSLI